MGISKAADYAILTVAYLSSTGKEGESGLRSKTDISQQLKLPVEFLSQILQKLARAGILASKRGVQGGYHLQVSPGNVTLLDVIEAIDGKRNLVECLSVDFKGCERLSICQSVMEKMTIVQNKIDDVLNSVNFADMAILN
ncbi:MAG: RrF2 family transcriptional regulator [Fidelibacterota bacterium]